MNRWKNKSQKVWRRRFSQVGVVSRSFFRMRIMIYVPYEFAVDCFINFSAYKYSLEDPKLAAFRNREKCKIRVHVIIKYNIIRHCRPFWPRFYRVSFERVNRLETLRASLKCGSRRNPFALLL